MGLLSPSRPRYVHPMTQQRANGAPNGARRPPPDFGLPDHGPGAAVAPPREAPRVRTVASRGAGLVNRIAERLGELVHPFGREEKPGRPHQLFVAQRVVRDALSHDLLLEQSNAVDETFGPRRASRYVDIDRDDRVDALDHRVVVEDPAGRGARAHGDGPLGLRHLVPDPPDDRRELERQPAGADQHVRLAGRKALALHAEAGDVEAAGRRGHVLDGAARRAERHRPERVAPGPVGQEIEPGGDPVGRDRRHGRRVGVLVLGGGIGQSHCSAPRFQIYTYPTARITMKTNISMMSRPAMSLSWRKATAHGIMNTVSMSKMMNSIATR